ncbi:MAG: iron-containing alcohol dehydrogenase [Syntrophales bacterium LBB04]|nr:iron-containing alcohol dehydrogenase [Syntrophales bacterium LBB04]
MWYFRNPLIVFGDDALEHLREIQGNRALIITDENLVKLGFVEKVAKELKYTGIEYKVFDQVEPDPSIETVKKGAQVALEYQPDWLIGLGGGSAMDAAKMIWMLYGTPDTEPYAITPFQVFEARSKAKMICIPTTSGTGSEVTWFMVVTDNVEQRKLAVGTPEAMADIAILDSRLIKDLPRGITSDTGMDVLSHTFEGLCTTWRSDFTDGPALMALKLVFQYLKKTYDDGSDMEAREHMLNASALASMAWANALPALLSHNMGHALGGFFHVTHGKCVGLYTPYNLEYVVEVGAGILGQAAKFIGLEGKSDVDLAGELIKKVRELARSIGQPLSVKELNIDRKAYQKVLPQMVERALGEASTPAALRIPDEKDMEKMFLYAYDGKPIDF